VAIAPDGSILIRITHGAGTGPTRREWRLASSDGSRLTGVDLPNGFTPFGFTRDGALYGGFSVASRQQLATVPVTKGTVASSPSHIILLPSGIHSAAISPDGARFAILATNETPDEFESVHKVVEPRRTSLYVVNADGTGGRWWCPALKDIADGPIAGGSLAWSRDSSSLALVSETPKIGFHDIHSFIDVCSSAGARRVTEVANAVSGIAWSGDDLVFLSTTTNVLTPDHVWTVPATGGTATDRTPSLQASAVSLSGDGHGRVWVVVSRGVQHEIDAWDRGQLRTAYRWADGTVNGPVASELAGGPNVVALQVGDPQHGVDVAIPGGDGLKRITRESDGVLGNVTLGAVRVVKWTSRDGVALEGIATFPAGYQPGERYPFVVLPHGGPESNDQLQFDFFSRLVAGLGYVVLQPEYRGSTGYGSEHMQAIYQHFGDRAFRDVDSATDFAIAQGWADPNRLAILGWSAGGFMTSWTVTQTARYKAAVEGAGITDWGSFMWTSDVQQWDYDARWPDTDPEPYMQFSAVMFANKVTTPLLILHGEADERVPAYQGREFYEALAARGKTVRMVTYPGSGHFPSLWEQRRDVFREIGNWLSTHVK
jgi:dienelactone hydrolase